MSWSQEELGTLGVTPQWHSTKPGFVLSCWTIWTMPPSKPCQGFGKSVKKTFPFIKSMCGMVLHSTTSSAIWTPREPPCRASCTLQLTKPLEKVWHNPPVMPPTMSVDLQACWKRPPNTG